MMNYRYSIGIFLILGIFLMFPKQKSCLPSPEKAVSQIPNLRLHAQNHLLLPAPLKKELGFESVDEDALPEDLVLTDRVIVIPKALHLKA